jgi:hypothetical protein
METVSKALRHRTTKTAETYYAHILGEAAFEELEEAWAGKAEPAYSLSQNLSRYCGITDNNPDIIIKI